MTIYEVQQENIRILEGMRIPPEEGIFRAMRGVIQNCRACMEAIERTEAEKRREAEREEAETPETGEGQAEEAGTAGKAGSDGRSGCAGSGEGGMRTNGQPAPAIREDPEAGKA